MVYQFGVIGPVPSVNKILEVAREAAYPIQLTPYPYGHPRETKNIIESYRHQVKGWFFSGPIPYSYVKETLHANTNVVYCKPTGASLYKALLQMWHEQDEVSYPCSIDMIESEELDFNESFLEAGVPESHYILKVFDYSDPQAIIDFHLKLWKEGKTQGALTCMNYVYAGLKEAGMPAYRIEMTKMDIRHAIKVMVEQAKSSYFKDTQIAVEIIQLEQFDRIAEKVITRYHLQYLELKVKQILLQFCEKIDGSLMEIGDGKYQIFSSRGAIEREMKMLNDTVSHISLEADVPVSVGVGYGKTAFSAENNARRALQYAKEKEEKGIVVVQENGLITEDVGEEAELTYSYRSHDKGLLEKLNQGNISIKTYKKIEALVQRMSWDGFTTSDLSEHLSMTKRNAQRIMVSLCELGLAEYGGEELQSVRGRPRKIYRLTSAG